MARGDALRRKVRPWRGRGAVDVSLPVPLDDLVAEPVPSPPARGGLRIAWVLPPLAAGSGGLTTIERFVGGLRDRGLTCDVYVYGPGAHESFAMAELAAAAFPRLGEVRLGDVRGDYDHVVATSWGTAYAVRRVHLDASRAYFIQDFEPSFYAMGSSYMLAENTYRFGFRGLTMGGWLAARLHRDYGMACSALPFAYDPLVYWLPDEDQREGVCFYARPSTARRGFELGVLALQHFAERNPEVPIHLFGEDLRNQRLPFRAERHGVLPEGQLAALFRRCSAGLVISLTNLSLLPLEMLACGCTPVVTEGPNNREPLPRGEVIFADPTPTELSEGLQRAIRRRPAEAAASVAGLSWDDSIDIAERWFIEPPRG